MNLMGHSTKDIVAMSPSKFSCCVGDKYNILNLSPKKTIEIRLFHGTVNHQLMDAFMEFALASTLFTKPSNKNNDWSYENFIKYVNTNVKYYPCLHKFLKNPQRFSL